MSARNKAKAKAVRRHARVEQKRDKKVGTVQTIKHGPCRACGHRRPLVLPAALCERCLQPLLEEEKRRTAVVAALENLEDGFPELFPDDEYTPPDQDAVLAAIEETLGE